MTSQQVLEFLNETPYYYNSLGSGPTFKERVGETEICIRRDKQAGGIKVACGDGNFHFFWDSRVGEWSLNRPVMVKA